MVPASKGMRPWLLGCRLGNGGLAAQRFMPNRRAELFGQGHQLTARTCRGHVITSDDGGRGTGQQRRHRCRHDR